ncbi:MAG: transcription elongation factor GreA [Candidatus Hydrogenedentota bacterium]
MDKIYISRQGLDKMKADLRAMQKRRMLVADTIEQARALGDLRENAEYHSAKEEQAMLHAKIKDVEDKITRAALIEEQDIDTSKVYQGAQVRVLNKKTNKEMTYRLVNHVEADLANGKMSTQSPVGKALLGRSAGETCIAQVPAGEIPLEILEITY